MIRQIIERSDSESDPEEKEEEDHRLARAIELSLTCPDESTPLPVPEKATRVVRFNLPLLDPPVRVAPRYVPVVPRMRSVRFRPPPAPIAPKPGPPAPPTYEQRMSATMRFFQATGQRPVTSHYAPNGSSSSSTPATHTIASVPADNRPEVTPEPEPEPADSDAESFVFE